MRIGIDATICLNRKPTGLGIYTSSIVNALSRLHTDIVVWTVDDTGMTVNDGRVRKVMQSARFLGDHLYKLRPFWVERVLPRLLKQEGVDVLFSTVPSALSQSPVPHVVAVMDLIPLAFPGEISRIVSWNYRHRIPAVLNNASALVAISDFTRFDVIKHLSIPADKVHTAYPGFDSARFTPKRDDAVLKHHGLEWKKYLLYVGNASPRKNLASLIQAFAAVHAQIPHQLVLCGSKTGLEQEQIRSLIDRFGIRGRVIVLDYVAAPDMPALYSGAALFAYVSLYEGFGLPILEAMACGTPVIASNTTSIPEVAGNAAILIDPNDCVSMARVIADTVQDPDRLQQLSQAGLQQAARFSWEKSAQQILALIKATVANRPGI